MYGLTDNTPLTLEAYTSNWRKKLIRLGLRDCHTQDDLIQEVAVRALRMKEENIAEIDLVKQLPKILSNVYFAFLRKEKIHRRVLVTLLERSADMSDQGDDHLFDLQVKELRLARNRLPEESQHLLSLRFEENLSYQAISQLIGTSETGVRRKLRECIDDLRRCLEQCRNN